MKLKLEVQNGIPVLTASESINAQDLLILKAGLNKLFQSGRKAIVLDVSDLTERAFASRSVIYEMAALSGWAHQSGFQLLLASGIEGLGQATDREQALGLLDSPMAKLLAVESKLQLQLSQLERERTEAEKKSDASSAELGSEIKLLRRQNSELKAVAEQLESQVTQFLKYREQSGNAMAKRPLDEQLNRVLTAVLEQEGVIPVA